MVMGNLQHCQYFKTREIFPNGAKVCLGPGDTFMKYEELNCRINTNYNLSEEAGFVCDNAVRHMRWWDWRLKISSVLFVNTATDIFNWWSYCVWHRNSSLLILSSNNCMKGNDDTRPQTHGQTETSYAHLLWNYEIPPVTSVTKFTDSIVSYHI